MHVHVREDPRHLVDVLEQQVGTLQQGRALLIAGCLEQRRPGEARAASEVCQHDVGWGPVGGASACCLAEGTQLRFARAAALDQPADHEVEVPADPGPDLFARWIQTLELGQVPEAVQDPVGERLQVRSLHDPAEHVRASHRRSMAPATVHVHSSPPLKRAAVRCESAARGAPCSGVDGRARAWIASLLAALAACAFAASFAAVAVAKPTTTFDPIVEAKNYSITLQRQAIYDTPDYQAKLAATSLANGANALVTQASDPERFFVDDLCWNQGNGCAGDIRLDDWASAGHGLVRPVLFTARNGATLSGHVWATVAGPAKRPAIVITNGSVQADEQMYWFAAQTLAKAGYVVLTFDPQGQGQSDTFGQAPDAGEGVPAQTDGRPFYDGTEDAINFLLSAPQHPYEPVPSCNTGTSHAAKQNSRVARGLDAGFDPFWQLIDRSEIGLAGHSYGAAGVSYIAQWDPRVKAVVAWDNLGGPGPKAAPVPGTSGGSGLGEQGCPATSAAQRVVPITKPGLGICADYGLPPTPNVSLPDPTAKSVFSHAYSDAGV